MAPAVRKALGLPPAEARIGLEAHDLLSATAADTILLTRARRDSGALTVSSRFLLRLEAAFGPLPRDAELEAALALDGVGRTIRLPMPAPAPPAAERPRLLRVTEADMLAADPFSFYARRMLGLRELDPLEQAADAAVKGTAVHRILERLVKEGAARREAIIADVLEEIGGDPALKHLWGPRLARMVDEAEAWLERDAAEGWLPEEAERKLASTFDGIRIEGKADRIDRDDDGWLRIVDYKTGKLPDQKDLRAGHFRQLPLLRLLVESDPAFADAKVAVLEYWKLSGGLNGGKRQGGNWTIEREVFEGELRALLGRYLWGDAPFQPKVSPVFARNYRAFDQLARIEEWL
jgi:ATP-dependent helicase/nuclease subunit B